MGARCKVGEGGQLYISLIIGQDFFGHFVLDSVAIE